MMSLRLAIRAALGMSAIAMAIPVNAQETFAVEEIIVTAQKREESVQDVPIAVTALTSDALLSQRIDFGAELTRAVPNLYFSRQLGGEYNFQIRGIGSQLTATSADSGVGLHSNNVPLSVNRIADADFFDLDRIEVLRGPQGTLYGRNATGGVINVITNKPKLQEFSSSLSLEYADFDTRKFNGYVNVPLGEYSAFRVAGTFLQRDGYSKNVFNGSDLDGRDLYSARVTYAFAPTENFRASLLWERFDEDDNRTGGFRDFCIKDPGPTTVGGVATGPTQNFLSRGCSEGSIYDPAALGSVNYVAALAGQLGTLSGLTTGDIYNGVVQSSNLREVAVRAPTNLDNVNDLYELNLELNVTDKLLLTSLTSYNTDDYLQNRAESTYLSNATFNNVAGLAPGGVYNDPQNGPSSSPLVRTIQDNESTQRTTELRLQSSFDGPVNFNAGGIYINLKRTNDLFIIPNTQNAFVQLANIANNVAPPAMSPFTSCRAADCYFDASAFPDGTGHNYFVSHVPYELTANALFGEVYYDINDKFRLTTGLRYTDDKKEVELNPSNILLPGRGASPNGIINQEARFKETTGRVNLDWHPTDNNLVYVSYSKGYKGGGINNPDATSTSPAYDPEFVNAYEVGSKNTFIDGRLQLNATAFMYDYKGYQISSRRGLISQTENIDAEVRGLELESVYKPIPEVRLNAGLGFLDTKITSGTSIDTFDRIQGQAGVTLVKSTSDACLAPTANLAALISVINANPNDALGPTALLGVCAGQFSSANPANPLAGLGVAVNTTPGNAVNLQGKELPQSPDFTASLGGQYNWTLTSDWELTFRADYYYQADSFMRIYNSQSDELQSWDNANAAITVDNKALGVTVQLYGKNLMDDDVITGFNTNSDLVGLTRTATILDPRIFGILVTKQF